MGLCVALALLLFKRRTSRKRRRKGFGCYCFDPSPSDTALWLVDGGKGGECGHVNSKTSSSTLEERLGDSLFCLPACATPILTHPCLTRPHTPPPPNHRQDDQRALSCMIGWLRCEKKALRRARSIITIIHPASTRRPPPSHARPHPHNTPHTARSSSTSRSSLASSSASSCP